MAEPNRDNQLQEYFDGELSPEEAEALRVELASDEELRAKLEGLEHLRVLIRSVLAPEHLSVPSNDVTFAAIEARLEEPAAADEGEAPRPALRVVDGGKADDSEADAPEPPRQAPAGASVWFGVAGLALAAAAALWFFVLRPGDVDDPGVPDAPRPMAALAPPPGSEIEQIDLGHSTGAIFQIEDEGARYAVVWIGDEKPPDLVANPNPDEERIQ